MLQFYLFLERVVPERIKGLIPERLRIALGYELKVRRRQAFTPDAVELTRPLRLPAGETEESLRSYLSSFHFEGEAFNQEMRFYLEEAFRRFLYTLQLVPEGDGKLLEIGANPYFMSLLLARFTSYELSYINYFGPAFAREDKQVLVGPDGPLAFPFFNVNIEQEDIPYAEDTFDVVLMGEVLEHFTNDPLRVLLNIKRVLRPQGHLVLTTPNVNRLVNVARMIAGFNIYDPYSGYGPYGRHNREYTMAELRELLTHAGFDVETAFSTDVHENATAQYADPKRIKELVAARPDSFGQYMFVLARNSRPASDKKPSWLYRAYPPDELGE
jgi:SAM-dependent methyltransferase